MPFTKVKCEKCGKDAESVHQFEIGGETVHLLKCDHILRRAHLIEKSAESITSIDGKKPFKFQQEGVKFCENSGGRCLICDEMGLGKTIQALSTIALHEEEMTPVVYFVKSSLKIQWSHEINRWVSKSDKEEDAAIAQVIETSRDKMLPGVKHYLFSFDLLRRFKNDSLVEEFKKRGVKTIVIDECQAIKNPDSERSRQVRKLTKDIPNVIALSGTPIKNNASEYFSILNILKPEMFPNYARFVYRECDSYNTGFGVKVGGLRYPEEFKKKTEKFIIRRERKEVMPDLPTVQRNFHFDSLGEEVEDAYKATFVEFRDDYFSANGKRNTFEGETNILAFLSRMRHLTGLSKINPVVDFVDEFLEDTDRKLTIFVHHKDVGEILMKKLTKLCAGEDGQQRCPPPLQLTADMNSEERARTVDEFMTVGHNERRILIASTLASGEGLNLQKCSDCIMMERQWNPANEEQAEGRFIRIGQESDKVTATYFVAVGTVDEFFARIVEEKREIVNKTLGSEAVKWDQSSLIKELAEVLAVQGGRMWNL